MIPVRIACSARQIKKIIRLTLEHHDQEAMMAYLIAERSK